MVYEIYIWENSESPGYQLAKDEKCYHIYYEDNGDCKGEGTSCDVTIENNCTIVTFCCEPPLA